MAHHEEPMDIDEINEDKENSLPYKNVLTSEVNITANIDAKTRSTPMLLMSKSYTDSYKDHNDDISPNTLTQSIDPSLSQVPKSLPLQTISSEQCDDVKGNSSVLKARDETVILDSGNLTVTVSDNHDHLSLPSTSGSPNSTPELLTPVNESPKPSGSPILRGLRSVLSMFRPSQSPIPGDEDLPKELPELAVNSPEPSESTNIQEVVASTPLISKKDDKKTVFKEGVTFDEDLEKALLWEEDTTILFSKEKIPMHKLLFSAGNLPSSLDFTPQKSHNHLPNNNLNVTSEPMDISFNNSVVANKTLTEAAPGEFVSANNSVIEKDDSVFLDCETTFNANDSNNVTNKKLEYISEEELDKETPEVALRESTENPNIAQTQLPTNKDITIFNSDETFNFTMNQTNALEQLSATKDIIEEIDSLTQDKDTTLEEKSKDTTLEEKSIEEHLMPSNPNGTIILQNMLENKETCNASSNAEVTDTNEITLLAEKVSTQEDIETSSKSGNNTNKTTTLLSPTNETIICENNKDITTNELNISMEDISNSHITFAEVHSTDADPVPTCLVPDNRKKLMNCGTTTIDQSQDVNKRVEAQIDENKTSFVPCTEMITEPKKKEYEAFPTDNQIKASTDTDKVKILEENVSIQHIDLKTKDDIPVQHINPDCLENKETDNAVSEEVNNDNVVRITPQNVISEENNFSELCTEPQIQSNPNDFLPLEITGSPQNKTVENKNTIILENNCTYNEENIISDSQAVPQMMMKEPNNLHPIELKSPFQVVNKDSDIPQINNDNEIPILNKTDSNIEEIKEHSENATSAVIENTKPIKDNIIRTDTDKKQKVVKEIIISENTSPFVSLSQEVEYNMDITEQPRSNSPPIQVKNTSYDMNFDEIEDPFNLKSSKKCSPSPSKSSPSTKKNSKPRSKHAVKPALTPSKETNSSKTDKNLNATYVNDCQSNANKTYDCTDKTNKEIKNEIEINVPEDKKETKAQFDNTYCTKSAAKDVTKELPPKVNMAEANMTYDVQKNCVLSYSANQTYTKPIENDKSNAKISNATFENAGMAPTNDNTFEVKSSNNFDDVNIFKDSADINTDEEDTLEGPEIEKYLRDFADQLETKSPKDTVHNEHHEEMFIDAEGFDFLMNQHNNEVMESGKESLFLKFDPLYANRVSSEGVVEALKNIRKRQSLQTKARHSNLTLLELSPPQASSSRVNNIMDDSIDVPNSTLAYPHKANSESIVEVLKNMGRNPVHQTLQWEDNLSLLEMTPSKCVSSTVNNNLMNESFDEFNSTMIHKPTMVVPPALNQILPNIGSTPSKPMRQSTAYMSPAMAVIDRLITTSANNSISNPDITLTQDVMERENTDLVFNQFREMLTGKELEVQNLKIANRELLNKLSTVESTLGDLEKESERKLKYINELSTKLADNTKANEFLQEAIAEYERTISYLVQEIEKDKQNNRKEKEKLIHERDEYLTHLSSVEAAFSDLHSKYEKSKQLIVTYKYQEQTQRRQIEESNDKIASLYKNYEALQQHAASKFEKAYNELDKINKQHESEMLKIKTQLKRKDMDIVSLEESLAQKTKVNEELTSICDDLISKVAITPPWQPNKLVAMATSDKHCQTISVNSPKIQVVPIETQEYAQVMYDETVTVTNAREIESPVESDLEDQVRSSMSKFNPPIRHTAKHHFDDTESDSASEQEDFLKVGDQIRNVTNSSSEDQSPDRLPTTRSTKLESDPDPLESFREPDNTHREPIKQPRSGLFAKMKTLPKKRTESTENSDSDSNELEDRTDPPLPSARKQPAGLVIPAEDAYDPKMYQDLKVPPEMENIFQYIMKYTPQKIDIDFKLQPFIPEYVPAVGDIDAFIKVTTPTRNIRGAVVSEPVLEHIDNLGLTVLDEPAAEQSDSALLHLQLRAMSKTSSAKSNVLTKKLENPEKNPKAVDRWIKDVSELHLSKPPPNVNYTMKMPDIDTLMEEWPESIEETLNDIGFPPATLDCSLSQYVDLICGIFDIPIVGDSLNDRIQALHVLFSLYSAVKNSQLYAERIKEEKGEEL